jgi:osmotically-inducible protein OsmY
MSSLAAEIERRLEEEEIHVLVEEDGGTLVLTGLVSSDEEKQLVIETAEAVAPGHPIEDNLVLAGTMPSTLTDDELTVAPEDAGAIPGASADLREVGAIEPGDFQSQETIDYPDHARGPSTSLYEDEVSEGDGVYVPPTDPVGTNREVIGGFSSSSMDSVGVQRSALDGEPGDEALMDAIRRELREDAATTDLEVDVYVEEGVAYLRGRVPYLEDAENAEEVAARVPGLVEVREELEVDALDT